MAETISDQLLNILNKLQQIRDKAQEGAVEQSGHAERYAVIESIADDASAIIGDIDLP